LSLHTLDSSKELYNTKTSSKEDQKPLAKPKKPVATKKNSRGGRNANKRVKQEDTKVKVEKKMKVCCTIV
jgi:hypothetical protein